MLPVATTRDHAFRWIISFALCAALVAACSKVPETTIALKAAPTPQKNRSYDQLAREARGAFLKEPRDIATVEISAQTYKEALAIRADEYEVLWEAARSCVWLGNYGPEDKRKDYVKQGLEYANTAVKRKPKGEEGLFYDGALAGKLADLDVLYGADGVKIIEGRMLQLIANKSTFIYGGPDRVLATLYMRAPGAPLSVGDYDKALKHMQRALDIEPHWLENQLSMAELEFRLGKKKNDPALTTSARRRLQEYFLKPGVKPPMAMGSAYEFKEWQKDARKLLEEYK
jgi:tetratricopeptide (TPR) repeat protein